MIAHRKFFLTVLFCLFSSANFAQVVINEVVASNGSGLLDEDGDFPDWIELHNIGGDYFNLNGFGISDDPDELFKYVLPELIIEPDSFVVIFANDKNKLVDSTGSVHVNFKLSASGETVFLTNSGGAIVDSLKFQELVTDHSYGRSSADLNSYFIFDTPTPGSSNPVSGFNESLEKPTVTVKGGTYTGSVEVVLENTDLADKVYFTTDGTDPTLSSTLFGESARTFTETTVLKLRTIEEGKLSSDIEVESYLIDTNHTLPVISLVTDPDYFFDEEEGIYVHFEEDIEVPVHIEFFEENGDLAFKAHAGTRIYGAYSRRWDQKSLVIYFRGEYGISELDYELFEEKNIETFQSFVLRNAGNDFAAAHIRDATASTIIENELSLDYQAYRPSSVYINGEYWGILNIREKISEHYIASNHPSVDPDSIDLIDVLEEPRAINGSVDDYLQFLEDLENTDVTNQEEYEAVTAQIDLENYIDYMTVQIFYANTDWPGNNVKAWKEKSPDGKWRWLLYDLEHGFNLYSGDGDYNLDMIAHTTTPTGTTYSNSPWATFIFRKLLENEGFKEQFSLRMNDLINTVFQEEQMISVIDSIAAGVEAEIPAHEERWGMLSCPWWDPNCTPQSPFLDQVEDMRHFARNRQGYMIDHIRTAWRLRGPEVLTVDVSGKNQGSVMVNRVIPKTYPWSGQYFTRIDIPVTAIPKFGYKFTGWTGDVISTDSVIYVQAEDSVFANFEPTTGVTSDIVINEIMYNAPEDADSEDWIELYNSTASTIDLSGWVVKDEDDSHIFEFESGTSIESGGYLVVAQDQEAFNQFYSGIEPLFGDLGFGLAGGSDQVRLFNADGELVDVVAYEDESPWPAGADGSGYSIELTSSASDNLVPSNWAASATEGGTPGSSNSTLVSNEEEDKNVPHAIKLEQNYPNPFNPGTRIEFELPERMNVRLTVYDILGRQVAELQNEVKAAGSYSVYWDASAQASGMYIYKLEAGGQLFVKKMLLIK